MSEPDSAEPDSAEPEVTLRLSDEEAQAVAEVAEAYAKALPPGREAPYEELVAAAGSGVITGAQVATVERVCVLALETGKARQIGSAETERLLSAVYRRTPGGTALTAETADVNRVLGQLAGRTLGSARLGLRMPGRYLLDLTVDGVSLQIAIEPEGLEVRTLQAG